MTTKNQTPTQKTKERQNELSKKKQLRAFIKKRKQEQKEKLEQALQTYNIY